VYLVRAEAPGYALSETVTVEVPREGELVLVARDPFVVTGIVRTPAGEPVHGARVDARYATDRDSDLSSRTDLSGAFEIRADRRDLVLSARRLGFAVSAAVAVEAPRAGNVNGVVLELRAGGALAGELHASLGDISGWDVEVNEEEGDGQWDTASDSTGRFDFDDLPPGRMRVVASLDPWSGAGRAYGAEVTIEAGRTANVVLGAPTGRAVQVHGRVLDADEPIPVARVHVLADGELTFTHDTSADADGRYEVRVPAPGEYLFFVELPEHSGDFRVTATVPATAEHELDLAPPSGVVRGRVVAHDGAPAPGVHVLVIDSELGSRQAATDAEGRFELTRVAPGLLTVQAIPAQEDHAHAVVTGVVLEHALDGLEIALARAGKVVGRITRAGIPAAHYVTACQGDVRLENATVRADEDGRFVLGKLPPGELVLRIHGTERAFPVTVVAGDTVAIELDLAE
jgi:hypothetical protein